MVRTTDTPVASIVSPVWENFIDSLHLGKTHPNNYIQPSAYSLAMIGIW